MSTISEATTLSASSEPVASSQGSIVAVCSANYNVVNSLTNVANPESQIPEIPNIPTELLIPPRVSRPSVEKQTATGKTTNVTRHFISKNLSNWIFLVNSFFRRKLFVPNPQGLAVNISLLVKLSGTK